MVGSIGILCNLVPQSKKHFMYRTFDSLYIQICQVWPSGHQNLLLQTFGILWYCNKLDIYNVNSFDYIKP